MPLVLAVLGSPTLFCSTRYHQCEAEETRHPGASMQIKLIFPSNFLVLFDFWHRLEPKNPWKPLKVESSLRKGRFHRATRIPSWKWGDLADVRAIGHVGCFGRVGGVGGFGNAGDIGKETGSFRPHLSQSEVRPGTKSPVSRCMEKGIVQ